MSFRDEDPKYQQLRAAWWEVVNRAHDPEHGTRAAELDNLMLASYRLQRYIRAYLRAGEASKDTKVSVPLLPEAIKNACTIVGHKNKYGSLFDEADSLEALSRASYRWLKENDKLIELNNE